MYIFIICPNNYGSTMLYRKIGSCSKAVRLSNEGQLLYGISNGAVNNLGLCKGKYFSECSDIFENPDNYNWAKIKEIWHNDWRKNKKEATIFVEKSPPNIFKVDLLKENFPDSRFIFMVRSPYAVVEGMIRRLGFDVERATKHWVKCTKKQIEKYSENVDKSVFLYYEDVCDKPWEAESKIKKLIPELFDIKFSGEIACHSIESIGSKQMPVKNYNEEQIKNLNDEQKELIEKNVCENFAESSEIFKKYIVKT